MLVLWIVSGSNEVAAQGFDFAENHGGIGSRIGASKALGDFFVKVYAFEEYRFSIEKQVAPIGLDRAQSCLASSCRKTGLNVRNLRTQLLAF